MSKNSSFPTPRSVLVTSAAVGAAVALALAVSDDDAIFAQDKYTVQASNGLSFSEVEGFEDWQTVAVSQTEDVLRVILANPAMIDAYRAGIPGNGKSFPDGSKIAKIVWKPKRNVEAPLFVRVPGNLGEVEFIEKDINRFPDSGGWGYAEFLYDAASDTFMPAGNDAKCGYACHTMVVANDYIFTAYGKR